MTAQAMWAAAAAACAVACSFPADSVARVRGAPSPSSAPGRRRVLMLPVSALAGCGIALVVGGPIAPVLGLLGAVGAWVVCERAEDPALRRRRQQARRELPAVVSLLAAALHAGADPGRAVDVVARAFPGPAADFLAPISARLALGVDPAVVWREIALDPVLAPLGRVLARAAESGSPVAVAVTRLGEDLAMEARAEAEDQARSVGVRAALPLGLCLLPAFVLLGIVPVVAGLVGPLLTGG